MKVRDMEFTLANGVKIPAIGFGTWQVEDGDEAYNSCVTALKAGYRHIDTAYVYGNEKSVGRALKDSGLRRDEVFITTKLPAEIKGYNETIQYFNESLANLDCEYIDLYLIHAPWPWSNVGQDCTEGNVESWKAMVDLYKANKIRAIGVSNFHPENIIPLYEATKVMPLVNQIRFFIGNTQEKIVKFCEENKILVEAYSPFATGGILEHPILLKLASKYNTTPAKICLRYCIQRNTLPLPKSVHEKRIYDNLDFDFVISDEDMVYLNNLAPIGQVKPLRS